MAKINVETAIVTGAASGLGYEFSLLLAKDNYNLVLIDIDYEKLEKAKANISELYNITITVLTKDLSLPDIANEIYNELQSITIDVIINNAGFGLFGMFHETDWQRESKMLNLHVLTTTHLVKLFLPDMVNRGAGKILNVSSLAAFQSGPLMALYYASKAYILSFSEATANELKGTGVTITAFCPGPTKTAFQSTVSENTADNKISFNMGCPKKATAYGYKAMQKGKVLAIPGFFNKFLSFLPRILTRSRATKIVRKIQQKNRDSQ